MPDYKEMYFLLYDEISCVIVRLERIQKMLDEMQKHTAPYGEPLVIKTGKTFGQGKECRIED